MRRSLSSLIAAAALLFSIVVATPATANATSARVARSSCAIMGLTPASMKPYFGVVAFTFAGYACGMTGDGVSVTLYLYSAGERAAVTKEVALRHAKRLGGLGPGAEFSNYGGGDFGLILTSGKHCVYIDGQLLPSQGKLISLAHVIYRAMA
jgi:hypothetical protein